jgi:hypothetical protein
MSFNFYVITSVNGLLQSMSLISPIDELQESIHTKYKPSKSNNCDAQSLVNYIFSRLSVPYMWFMITF